MSHAIDIRDVIQKTTSEVDLEQLQKKGFTKVKVLDRGAIKRMIAEAVNKVVEDRQAGLSDSERERLREEAKEEFDVRMREHRLEESKQRDSLKEELQSREGRVDKLREEMQSDRDAIEARESQLRNRVADLEARETKLTELATRAEEAESRLREADQRLAQLREVEEKIREQEDAIREREIRVQLREEAAVEPAAPVGPSEDMISDLIRSALREVQPEPTEAKTEDLSDIRESLQNLAASISRGGGGGAGNSDIAGKTDAASIEELVKRAGLVSSDMENNLERIEVKESKAKSVNANLAKLKNLKKGGA